MNGYPETRSKRRIGRIRQQGGRYLARHFSTALPCKKAVKPDPHDLHQPAAETGK